MNESENYDEHILKFTNLLLSKQEGQDPVNIIPEMLLKNNKKMLDFKINMAIYSSIAFALIWMFFWGVGWSFFMCFWHEHKSSFFPIFFLSIILTYYLSKYFFKKFIF